MKKPRLGLAMIVNNVERESPGSVADVKALESAYNKISFDVRIFNNCTKQVIIRSSFLGVFWTFYSLDVWYLSVCKKWNKIFTWISIWSHLQLTFVNHSPRGKKYSTLLCHWLTKCTLSESPYAKMAHNDRGQAQLIQTWLIKFYLIRSFFEIFAKFLSFHV